MFEKPWSLWLRKPSAEFDIFLKNFINYKVFRKAYGSDFLAFEKPSEEKSNVKMPEMTVLIFQVFVRFDVKKRLDQNSIKLFPQLLSNNIRFDM